MKINKAMEIRLKRRDDPAVIGVKRDNRRLSH